MQAVEINNKSNKTILNRYNLEDNHWFYRGIRAILKNNFEKLLKNNDSNLTKPLQILDIGCGSGANLFWLQEYGNVYGIDISEFAIDCAKKRGLKHLTVGSAEELPYEDNYFDFVFSVQVFYSIPGSDLKAWEEAYRVLKPGGYFISLLPAYNFLFSNHDLASGTYRRYDIKDILKASDKSRFEIYKVTFYNFLLFPLIAGFRLISKILSRGNLVDKTDLRRVNTLVNYILTKIIYLEVLLSNLVSYPCGLSVFSIHRKSVKS